MQNVNRVANMRPALTFGTYTVHNVNGAAASGSRLTKCTDSPALSAASAPG